MVIVDEADGTLILAVVSFLHELIFQLLIGSVQNVFLFFRCRICLLLAWKIEHSACTEQ